MATYLDSSAIVKLAVREPESAALRRYLRRRRSLVSSALARAEVLRSLLPGGEEAVARGRDVLTRLDLLRVNDRVLHVAGTLLPVELRLLDAIHLASAQQLGSELASMVSYDDRLSEAARQLGGRCVLCRRSAFRVAYPMAIGSVTGWWASACSVELGQHLTDDLRGLVRGERIAAFRLGDLSGKGFDCMNTADENMAQRFAAGFGVVERRHRRPDRMIG